METGEYILTPIDGGKIYVRVSGPQVGENKKDVGDRPCMYVFPGHGEELVGHEVVFHGESRIIQEFEEGCPTTGAILWIETTESVTLIVRENHDTQAHEHGLAAHTIDDVERGE